MPSAEIITIGTELLLGEIVDTNARHIARTLRATGIDVYRTTTVGDNVERIAATVREAMGRADIVIATGGLGPTVDDATREAVALALGTTTEFRPELWEQVQAVFRRYGVSPSDNNRRQAHVPRGAIAVENPVGTAPAFIAETARHAVIALPGVPREMEHLLEHAVVPYLRERFRPDHVIVVRVLHTAGVGESLVDERIADLEALANPTVGLAAHAGQVDVRITARAPTEDDARARIDELEQELRRRLGDWVYGADEETLEAAATRALRARGWRLAVVEAGLGGALLGRLAPAGEPFAGGETHADPLPPDEMHQRLVAVRRRHGADVGLAVSPAESPEAVEIHVLLVTPDGERRIVRPYGGHRRLVPPRAANLALDELRGL